MGLDQFNRFFHKWGLPLLVAGVAVLISVAGDSGRDVLSYNRPALQSGEIWRLVTAHVTHLGWSHLLLNLAGLALIWYLVSAYFGLADWLIVLGVSIVGVDAGLWWFEPQLVGYVGLSGVLHGLLAAGVVAGLRSGRAEVWVLGIVLVLKIAWEQFAGPLPGSEEASGGAVIVTSHAWGALAGATCAAVLIRVRGDAPI